jgi:hypothetical protein
LAIPHFQRDAIAWVDWRLGTGIDVAKQSVALAKLGDERHVHAEMLADRLENRPNAIRTQPVKTPGQASKLIVAVEHARSPTREQNGVPADFR